MNRTGRGWSAGLGLTALAFAFLASRGAQAHAFGDDYGDSAATAQAVAIGSNYTGRLELDVDQDWFSFRATNSLKEYVVTVTTGTLWNSTVALMALDGVTGIMETDSVRALTSRVSWIHVGPPATYYVRVGGFAQFTTGTYSVVVNQQDFSDPNRNGMPDAWELQYFQSTHALKGGPADDWDGDGIDNLEEFRSGTDPTDPNSCLRLTDIASHRPVTTIRWATAPHRWYSVEASTNLSRGLWDRLGTVTNVEGSGLRDFDDPARSLPARFYRVRCLY